MHARLVVGEETLHLFSKHEYACAWHHRFSQIHIFVVQTNDNGIVFNHWHFKTHFQKFAFLDP